MDRQGLLRVAWERPGLLWIDRRIAQDILGLLGIDHE